MDVVVQADLMQTKTTPPFRNRAGKERKEHSEQTRLDKSRIIHLSPPPPPTPRLLSLEARGK
jgi:hypothetical protein